VTEQKRATANAVMWVGESGHDACESGGEGALYRAGRVAVVTPKEAVQRSSSSDGERSESQIRNVVVAWMLFGKNDLVIGNCR
jgi:hypothetical protein